MKKILFVATVTHHINTFHIPYLKMFKEKGYEVHVASRGKEKVEYCDKHYDIQFERFPLKPQNIKAYKELKNIINQNKYEIIHCHTPVGGVLTRLAAKKARKAGTRVIYTAHGFHFYKGAPTLNWLIYYPLEKYLSKYTDDLITINNEDYQIAKKKFKAKNTHYIQGVGVNKTKFDFLISEDEKDRIRKELHIAKNDFVIIYPAELSKRKNQKMLIESMKLLVDKDEKYKLLLPGKDSLNGKYQQLVKQYGLEDNIKFLGFRKDIPKLFKISDLAVSTSKQEGLPVNLIEAMMSGLPVIATDCRGNRDLTKTENLIKNGDIQKLVMKIEKSNILVKNENLKELEIEEISKEMEKIYII